MSSIVPQPPSPHSGENLPGLDPTIRIEHHQEGRYSTELWAEEAVNNIEDRANSSQPWFLQVGVGELLFFVICVPGGVLCTKGALPGMKVFVRL